MSSAMAPSMSLSSPDCDADPADPAAAGAGVDEAVDEAVVVVVEPDCGCGLAGLPCEMLLAAPRTRFVKPILARLLARARVEANQTRSEPRFEISEVGLTTVHF